jgi:integrase
MTRHPKRGKGSRWTVQELDAVPATWKGDTLSDGEGLIGEVRVSSAGEVSVRFKSAFKWNGKVAWFQCGTWSSIALAEIRARRDSARTLVSTGVNPNDQKKAHRLESQAKVEAAIAEAARKSAEDLTFRSMYQAWLDAGVKRADGNAEVRRTFEKDVLPALGDRPVRLVTDQSLLETLRAVGRGRGVGGTAMHLLQTVRQLYHWSVKRQPWRSLMPDGNPAELVELKQVVADDYEEEIRDRTLSDAELHELADKLASMRCAYSEIPDGEKYGGVQPLKEESEVALWIQAATVCRGGELLQSEWANVNFEECKWFLPAAITKTKQDLTIYLSPFAVRQFKRLHKLTGHTDWLFPARPVGRAREGAGPPTTHIGTKSVSKQVGDRQVRFMARPKGLKRRLHSNTLVLSKGANGNWTPHDLRRTGATRMQALGIPDDIIDRCLNHRLPGSKVRRHYLHHEFEDQMRNAWRVWGDHLERVTRAGSAACPSTHESIMSLAQTF